MNAPITKISQLRAAADAGDWPAALRIAAKFPRLGDDRGAILDAHMAVTRPEFCRQIRKDPDALLAAGIQAIKDKWLSRTDIPEQRAS